MLSSIPHCGTIDRLLLFHMCFNFLLSLPSHSVLLSSFFLIPCRYVVSKEFIFSTLFSLTKWFYSLWGATPYCLTFHHIYFLIYSFLLTTHSNGLLKVFEIFHFQFLCIHSYFKYSCSSEVLHFLTLLLIFFNWRLCHLKTNSLFLMGALPY